MNIKNKILHIYKKTPQQYDGHSTQCTEGV